MSKRNPRDTDVMPPLTGSMALNAEHLHRKHAVKLALEDLLHAARKYEIEPSLVNNNDLAYAAVAWATKDRLNK